MAQMNLRLDEGLVRRFETVAAAVGKTNRQAAAEALEAWADAHVDAVRAVVGGGGEGVQRPGIVDTAE